MAKPDLRQALSQRPPAPPPASTTVPGHSASDRPRSKTPRTDRASKKFVGGYFDKGVHKQISIMAAEMERDIDDLVGEALNDLFAKHRRPELVILKAQKQPA